MNLLVTVQERCAKLAPETQALVCGYGKREMTITFDREWNVFLRKNAQMTYFQDGKRISLEIPFIGSICELPAVYGTDSVEIGFCAGEIRTTTPVRIPCLPCITGIPAEEYRPQPDAARLILAKLAGQEAAPPCSGLYLVTKDADYLVTDAGDFLLTKE